MTQTARGPRGGTARSTLKHGRVSPKANPRTNQVLLSACMIVKNEEKTLADCFASLHRVVDEVVVYDTGSDDNTVQLAERAGARVMKGYWDDDFGRARNDCLEECRGAWILWIDADERFVCDQPTRLRGALQQLLVMDEPDALLVDIYNLGGDGSTLSNVHRALRIFRKDTCHWYGSLHEQVDLRLELESNGRHLQAAPLEGAHLDHYGYMDEFIRDRDKLARNLRLAEAALDRKPKPGLEGIAQLNFARALAAVERHQEAHEQFEIALATVRDGVQKRTVLFHFTQNLITLGRYQDAIVHAKLLRQECQQKGLADYYEGVARRRMGELDQAIRLLEQVNDVRGDDGYAFPDATLRAELAGALVEAGRPDEAARHLVSLIRQNPDVLAMTVALKVFASTGRGPEELAEAMPEDHLDKVGAALLLVPPVAAAPVAEALVCRLGPRPPLLAAATRFAPSLPTLQALEWSARLRAIGMKGSCPLLAKAHMTGLDPVERVRAAVTAHAAFGDSSAGQLAVVLASGVHEHTLATVLAEINLIDPALLDAFSRAAAIPGAPDADPFGSVDTRTRVVADALSALGRVELSRQIRNITRLDEADIARSAQLVASGADG